VPLFRVKKNAVVKFKLAILKVESTLLLAKVPAASVNVAISLELFGTVLGFQLLESDQFPPS
jgi:hypothetical protein